MHICKALTFSSNALWCSNKDLRAFRTSTSLDTPAGEEAWRLTTVILSDRSWRDTRHSKCSKSNCGEKKKERTSWMDKIHIITLSVSSFQERRLDLLEETLQQMEKLCPFQWENSEVVRMDDLGGQLWFLFIPTIGNNPLKAYVIHLFTTEMVPYLIENVIIWIAQVNM